MDEVELKSFYYQKRLLLAISLLTYATQGCMAWCHHYGVNSAYNTIFSTYPLASNLMFVLMQQFEGLENLTWVPVVEVWPALRIQHEKFSMKLSRMPQNY